MTFHPKRLIGPASITDTGVVRYDSTAGLGVLVQDSAGVIVTDAGNLTVTGDANIGGNLIVDGYQVVTQGENVLYADNHLYLNAGYTINVAQTGGLVVNYLPTTTTTVVENEYIAGVDGVYNPSVFTDGYETFSADDFIQISLADADGYNEGLFEVLDHTGYVLTIRGIGTDATIEDFTQKQFDSIATDGATITKVNVSIIRTGVDGVWESAFGSSSGLVFVDFGAGGGTVTGGGSNNQVSVWSGATSQDGSSSFTFDGTTLGVDAAAVFNESGADVDFRVESDTKTHALFVQGSDGNVGINNSTPAQILHVIGTDSTAVAFKAERETTSTTALSTAGYFKATSSGAASDGFGPYFRFTIEDSSAVSADIGGIAGVRDGADDQGALLFTTRGSGDGSPVERMRIDDDGFVGIGKTPTVILDIEDSETVAGQNLIRLTNTAVDTLFTSFAASAINLQHIPASGVTNTGKVAGAVGFIGQGSDAQYTVSDVSGYVVDDNSDGVRLNTVGGLRIRTKKAGDATTPQERLDFNGTEAVFNNDGLDYDFRVEGVGEANALFVQGSDGNVGIGDGSPAVKLDVLFETNGGNGIFAQNTSTGISARALMTTTNDASDQMQTGVHGSNYTGAGIFNVASAGFYNSTGSGGIIMVAGHASGDIAFAAGGTATTNERLRLGAAESVFNEAGQDVDFRVESDTATHAFFVQGSDGFIGVGTDTPINAIHVATGGIRSAYEDSDTNNVIHTIVTQRTTSGTAAAGIGSGILLQAESAAGGSVNAVQLEGLLTDAGGGSFDGAFRVSVASAATLDSERMRLGADESVFNEDGLDVDFRVESDTKTHALFVQGSDGFVGIGHSAPTQKLHLRADSGSNIGMAISDADVSHSFTDFFDADMWYHISSINGGGAGGTQLQGLSDGDNTGLRFVGAVGSTDPTDTTAAIEIRGTKLVGNDRGSMGDDETAVAIMNHTAKLVNILGDGRVGFGTTAPSSLGLITVAGNVLPSADDTYNLGDDTLRWKDGYFGPGTLHIGTSVFSDEATLAYNTASNDLVIDTGNEVRLDNGILAVAEGTAPSGTAGYGKLFVDTADGEFKFVNNSGATIDISGASGTVGGTGTDGYISYWSGTNTQGNDTNNIFYWDDTSGRLGLGTDVPMGAVQIDLGTHPNAALIGAADSFIMSDDDFTAIRMISASSGVSTSPFIASTRTRGTVFNPTTVADGDLVFCLEGHGFDGTARQETASIYFEVDGTVGTNQIPQSIVFQTGATTTASRAERMRIDSAGQVGINTDAPVSTLDVQGSMSIITTTITTSTSLTASHNVVLVDASSGVVTVTLPAVATNGGRKYHIKKIDSSSNNVVVDGTASETVDGDLTQTMTLQYESLTVVNDGSEWFII